MINLARGWRRTAGLLTVALSAACVDTTPTAVLSAPENRDGTTLLISNPPALRPSNLFAAWSYLPYRVAPIETQPALSAGSYRQYTGGNADADLLAFVAANPGRLYIHGDEPDQYCVAPADYARSYHDFAVAIRNVDPSAKLSPAGFAEPNGYCGGYPHSTAYAELFYNAYVSLYGSPPPVDEWRFHDFGLNVAAGDVHGWYNEVSAMAAWSVAHGAPMVLGSWGFLAWNLSMPDFHAAVQEAGALLRSDSRIVQAVWWSYEQEGTPRFLANPDGTLTPEGHSMAMLAGAGQTLAISMIGPTEVPVGITRDWWPSVSGDSGPFTYQWYLDGVMVSTAPTFESAFGEGERHRLRVSVSSASGGYGIAEQTITVMGTSECDFCPLLRSPAY